MLRNKNGNLPDRLPLDLIRNGEQQLGSCGGFFVSHFFFFSSDCDAFCFRLFVFADGHIVAAVAAADHRNNAEQQGKGKESVTDHFLLS